MRLRVDSPLYGCAMVKPDRATSNSGFCQLRGAAMLNIRINLTINLKKTYALVVAGILIVSNLFTPAYAIQTKESVRLEKVVMVQLDHVVVKTTRTEALEALNSPQVKYFDAQALAFLTTYARGWNMQEWGCLNNIWTNESHFNPLAKNKSSGAYGIAQFLPSTWGNYNLVKTPVAKLQIQYGIHYIEKRYGNACTAWRFWQRHKWY